MAHTHMVQDDDLYFVIDANTKNIMPLSEEPAIICQADHNSERITFEVPRHIEGHDMLQCDKVEVHYINISSSSSSQKNVGIYKVVDLQVAEDDENILLCSWLVSQNATEHVGTLNFVLRFACTVGSKIDYLWSTTTYSGIQVVETIDNTDIVATQYADILEQWYAELMSAGTAGVNVVVEALNKALEDISHITNETITDIGVAKQEAIDDIKTIDVVVEVETEVLERIRTAGENAAGMAIANNLEGIISEVLLRLPLYKGETDQREIITFTLSDGTNHYICKCLEGMTWAEYIESSYYNDEVKEHCVLTIENDIVILVVDGFGTHLVGGSYGADGTPPTAKIEAGTIYYNCM